MSDERVTITTLSRNRNGDVLKLFDMSRVSSIFHPLKWMTTTTAYHDYDRRIRHPCIGPVVVQRFLPVHGVTHETT